MMKAKEFKGKTWDELKRISTDMEKEIFTLRISVAKQQTKNVRIVKIKRKELARVKTIMGSLKRLELDKDTLASLKDNEGK